MTDFTSYVNIKQGTASNMRFSSGNTLPLVSVPFGMHAYSLQTFGKLMDRGNRVTAINARLRALFVFLHYCFDQEYLAEFPLSKIKEDDSYKEP